jgi:hypothetical protein
VDWEFAGEGRALQDMAQFGEAFFGVDLDVDVGLFPQGAHLHLQTMAESALPFSPSSSSTSTFIHALYNSHRKQGYDSYAPWLHDAA